MVTNFALCTLIVLNSFGVRTEINTRGHIIKDESEYWVVDFTDSFKRLGVMPPYIKRVNGNSCLYVK